MPFGKRLLRFIAISIGDVMSKTTLEGSSKGVYGNIHLDFQWICCANWLEQIQFGGAISWRTQTWDLRCISQSRNPASLTPWIVGNSIAYWWEIVGTTPKSTSSSGSVQLKGTNSPTARPRRMIPAFLGNHGNFRTITNGTWCSPSVRVTMTLAKSAAERLEY